MDRMIDGFLWGFGFWWSMNAWLGVMLLVALFFAAIIGGLSDRYQRSKD